MKDVKEEVMRDFKWIRDAALLDMDRQDDESSEGEINQTHMARDIESFAKDILRKLGLPIEANLDVGELPADPLNLFEAIRGEASNLVLSGSLATSPSCARRILHLARAVEQRCEEQCRQTPETNPLQRVAPYSRRIFPLDELTPELSNSEASVRFTEMTQQNPTQISGEAVGSWTAPSARYEACSAEKTELDAVEEETTERSALLRPELPDRVALVKEIRGAAEAGEALCRACRRVLHSEHSTTPLESHTCERCSKVILPTAHRPQPQTYSCFHCHWSVCFDCCLPQDEQRRMIDAMGFHRGFLGPDWHNLHIGGTRLHLAAREGDVQQLKALLKHETVSIDINSQDCSERTPLHDLVSSERCTLQAVEFMLHHKASVAARDNIDQTPLHLAAQRGHKEVVDFLIQHGADVAARDDFDTAPLHVAAAMCHKEVVDLLLQHGADVAARDDFDTAPLHVAAAMCHKEVVDLLLQHGADVAARDDFNTAPLHLAAQRGHKEVVDLLIQHGADVAAHNELSKAPLHVAAAMGHKEVVDLLIQHGADAAARDQLNKSPRPPAAGHVSNSAGTSTMPETTLRPCENAVPLHQEQWNSLPAYLGTHRQHVEECCKAYRTKKYACLRSHELRSHERQSGEISTRVFCYLCGSEKAWFLCSSCAECSWDACRDCINHLRKKVDRLQLYVDHLQVAETSLQSPLDGGSSAFFPIYFDAEKPLHPLSLIAVTAALGPSDQKLAICLESIQLMQILDKPLPNERYSRTLKEAADRMRNRQTADMLLKVSDSLAPKSAMPDAAIPELPESKCHPATSRRCRCVSNRRLVLLLCVAVLVLALCIFHLQDRTRFHQKRRILRYQKALVVVTSTGLAFGAVQLCSQCQSPTSSKPKPLVSREIVAVGELAVGGLWINLLEWRSRERPDQNIRTKTKSQEKTSN